MYIVSESGTAETGVYIPFLLCLHKIKLSLSSIYQIIKYDIYIAAPTNKPHTIAHRTPYTPRLAYPASKMPVAAPLSVVAT
jgi:hypothetical protein